MKRFKLNKKQDRKTVQKTRMVENSKNKVTIQRGGIRF